MSDLIFFNSLFLLVVCLILFIVSLAIAIKFHHKHIYAIIAIILFIIGLFSTVWLITTQMVSAQHGNYAISYNVTTIGSMIEHSPSDQSDQAEAVTDTHPTIFLYRFGCPDCEITFDQLNEWKMLNTSNSYWVSSKTAFGKTLVDTYHINEVPAILYFDNNTYHVLYPMQYWQNNTLNTANWPEIQE